MLLALHLDQVGDALVVGVGVVHDPLLHQQLARVHARRGAAIPAVGALASGLADGLHGQADALALDLALHGEVLLPTVAVGVEVVAGRADRPRCLGIALERDDAHLQGPSERLAELRRERRLLPLAERDVRVVAASA